MIVFGLVLGVAFVLWRIARRKRKRVLAGLDSGTPVFSVEPSKRWSTKGRDHRL